MRHHTDVLSAEPDQRFTGCDRLLLERLEPRVLLSTSFYVAPWGSDAAPGSLSAPLASLEGARDAIRQLSTDSGLPAGGVTVYLRGGSYERSSVFNLTSLDSGEADKPIVYKAYNNEEVQLMGGVSLSHDWFSLVTSASAVWGRLSDAAKGNLLVADLNGRGIDLGRLYERAGYGWDNIAPPELILNGQVQTLGRTEGWQMTATTPEGQYAGSFTYSGTAPERWSQAEDIWFSGLFTAYWFNTLVGGTVDVATKTIQLTTPPHLGIKPDRPYFAFNLLEEIDRPGEYYISRDTGKLYFWAPETLDAGDEIHISQMTQELLNLSDVQYVTFEGVTFEGSREDLVVIDGGSHNELRNCRLRNSGATGVRVSGYYNGLEACRVYATGEHGVRMTGGDRPTLTASNNYVRNTDLHEWGRWVSTSKMAVHLEGAGHIIAHNRMHDATNGAIWYYGNNHLIEYNDIHNVCSATADAGAIYSGRDWSHQGNVIRYNFIHDMSSPFTTWQVFGVYLDDAVSSAAVYGNLFYKLAGFATLNLGGRDNVFTNNLIVKCYGGHRADRRGVALINDTDGYRFLERLNAAAGGNYQTGVWAQAYPKLAVIPNSYDLLGDWKNPGGSVFSRNFGWANKAGKWLSEGAWGAGLGAFEWYEDISNNIENADPLFVDEAGGDFNLRPNSPVYGIPGWQDIPFDQIGIQSGPTPPNSAPVANDDTATTTEDTAVRTSSVLANDTDADGDTLAVTGFTQGSHGSVVYHNDGTFTYTPASGFIGDDSFGYGISDGRGGTDQATVAVTVAAAPVPSGIEVVVDNLDGGFQTTGLWAESSATDEYEGSSVYSTQIGASAVWTPDLDDAGRYELYVWYSGMRSSGTPHNRDSRADYTVVHAGGTTTIELDQDASPGEWVLLGEFDFLAGSAGSVALTHDAEDSATTSADAVRFVLLTPPNIAPVANDDTATTTEDTAVRTGNVLANDTDADGDTLAVTDFTQGDYGSVIYHGDGTFTYTPVTGFAGDDSFGYSISDGRGGTDQATVTVTVAAAPVPSGVEVIVDNLDDGFQTTGLWAESSATDEYEGSSVYSSEIGASAVWAPALADAGRYEVYVWYSGMRSSGTPHNRDSRADYTVVHAGGTTTIELDQDASPGEWVLLGEFDFVSGSAGSVAVTHDAEDSATTSADAVRFVLLAPTPPNIAPVANDDTATTTEGTAVRTANVLANDTDEDGDTLAVTDFTQGGQGSVVYHDDGTFTYAPADGFAGSDSFSYTVSDGRGGTDQATVAVTVTAVPVIVDNLGLGFQTTGLWAESSAIDEYDGSSVYSSQIGASATWTPDLVYAGHYEVYVWYSGMRSSGTAHNRDSQADYTIVHAGGTTTVELDQDASPGEWVLLGEFDFLAGSDGHVAVTHDAEDSATTSADAVKFVLATS